MKSITTPTTYDTTTIPFPPPHPAPLEQTVQPEPDTPEQPARRGRPSTYSEKVIDMLRAAIRQYGLSDSAAAERVGMSTTTLSRWKKQYPELGPRLKESREGCRSYYLDIVMRHAEADDARGLRAATWILERLFPRDYSPRMRERFDHVTFEEQERYREERAVLDEDCKEACAKRDAWYAAQDKAKAEAAVAEAAQQTAESGEIDSHNSENAGEAEASREERPDPVDAGGSRSAQSSVRSGAPHRDCADHDLAGRDHGKASGRSSGRGRPGSLDEAARPEDATIYAESDSHNCRNASAPASPAKELGRPRPEDLPEGCDLTNHGARRENSTISAERDSHYCRQAGGAEEGLLWQSVFVAADSHNSRNPDDNAC